MALSALLLYSHANWPVKPRVDLHFFTPQACSFLLITVSFIWLSKDDWCGPTVRPAASLFFKWISPGIALKLALRCPMIAEPQYAWCGLRENLLVLVLSVEGANGVWPQQRVISSSPTSWGPCTSVSSPSWCYWHQLVIISHFVLLCSLKSQYTSHSANLHLFGA